jgi:hypothetical protein
MRIIFEANSDDPQEVMTAVVFMRRSMFVMGATDATITVEGEPEMGYYVGEDRNWHRGVRP